MAEIRKMQELKHKEIEEKLEKLKEVTGNTDLAFEDDDIDGDFDPEAHDRRMKELFNDEFYQGPEGDQKPQFPTIDEELEIGKIWVPKKLTETMQIFLLFQKIGTIGMGLKKMG